MKATKIGNKEIDYTTTKENTVCCWKCKRQAKMIEDQDYIYFIHKETKAYLNGTYINSFSTDECKVLG